MAKRIAHITGQQPLFRPDVRWRPAPVSSLPSWAGAKRVGIDIETYDPKLKKLGPGVRRGGKIVGISFKIEDGPGAYLPVGHAEGNLPPEHVDAYMKDQSACFEGDLVGANLPYDIDFLWQAGYRFPKVKRYRDIQVVEPLLDELQMSYSLDNIAMRYGLPGKSEDVLREAATAFGVDAKKGMWNLPSYYVGEYAIQDVALPLQILRRQERLIEERDLWQIYDLETKLTPTLVKMRRRGVLVDQKHLEHVEQWTIAEQDKEMYKILALTGVRLAREDVNKAKALAKALQAIGVTDIPTTPKTGAPSIDKFFLAGLNHPLGDAILRAKKLDKLRNTFCNSLREHMTNGRIHCTFNQMRRSSDSEGDDDEGARYGRLSCTDPNLQQQPARDPETGKLWRSVYIPDPGLIWAAKDYSQQEPRLTYHFAYAAKCYGAEAIIRRFNEDLDADSHTEFTMLVWPDTDKKSKAFKERRGYAKQIFLGVTYGMGGAKLCRKLDKPTQWIWSKRHGKNIEVAGPEGQSILDTVDQRMPYLRELARLCENTAKTRGYIKTLLGRHCHFPRNPDGEVDWAHKALNRLVQGSAADQTKLAVVQMEEAGWVTEDTSRPGLQLQIHDELDSSVENEKQAEEMADIMRTCVKLSLPSKVDVELGKSWGDSM